MPYDFSDPNFNFAGQEDIIIRALREAAQQQATPFNQGVRAGHAFAASGADPGAFLSRAAGRINQQRAEQERMALGAEQQRRYSDLSRQLNTPGEVDYTDPNSMVADNARRMELAGQMGNLNLPQAQRMAQAYLAKGTNFPEAIAKMQSDRIERGEQAAMRLQEIEAQKARDDQRMREIAANRNQTNITIAGMPSRSSIGGGDKIELTPKQELIMRDKHAKDWAAAEQAGVKTNIAVTNADELVADPGFKHLFGTTSLLTRQLPQARTAAGKLESLKSNLKAAGLEAMRAGGSIGAMTEKEWPIVEAMISGLDSRMSPDEAATQIDKIKARIERINEVARDAYKMEWGASPYYKEFGAKPGYDAPVAPAGGGFKILGVREK